MRKLHSFARRSTRVAVLVVRVVIRNADNCEGGAPRPVIPRQMGFHLSLHGGREETGVLHGRKQQQQASVPNEFDPQHGHSPRNLCLDSQRIRVTAEETVLAITKMRFPSEAISARFHRYL